MSLAELYREDQSDDIQRREREESRLDAENVDGFANRSSGVRMIGTNTGFGSSARHRMNDEIRYRVGSPVEPGVDAAGHGCVLRKRPRESGLDKRSLDHLADRYGYTKIETLSATSPLASYRRESCHLNFWLTTGTVGSYLDHPNHGRKQLIHRDVNLHDAERIFENPRIHTDKSYRRKTHSVGLGSCRYGEYRCQADCWFDR